MNTLRWKLRALAAAQNLKTSTLAERIGVHRSVLCRYFNGETDLRASVYEKLLAELGIDLGNLVLTELSQGPHVRRKPRVPVDLWDIILQLDDFSARSTIDRILACARRQRVHLSAKTLESISAIRSRMLVLKLTEGGN
ncbi:MAG: helix-turn-helix transcriptional regulator [Bdellovibrionales bacterium]|nr:helix-turn-helix transcriptional regulator [Bdellovibrionales bacterium]